MKASLPLSVYDTVSDLKTEIGATTENVGNIVHNEAVAKSFEMNRLRSCMAPMYHFYVNECKRDRADFQRKLTANFDAVVFSLANLISPPLPGAADAQQKHMELLCEIIDAIPVPFYLFGLGLQNAVDDIGTLVPGMVEFLELLNKKAVLFGVRGAETESFMHRNGFTNAKALGCPSLYLYPENIYALKTPNLGKDASALTAGHLWLRHIFGYEPHRLQFLRNLAETYKTQYVFQDDIYSYHELLSVRGFYDDASGIVDKHVMESYLVAHGLDAIPFDNYWHFRDARAWRLLAQQSDFYFGDRFHGGVVSLQVGKPALFMYNDLRVEEMTGHIGAPQCSFDDIKDRDLGDVLAEAFAREKLEQFKDTYSMRAAEYFDACKQAGIIPLQAVQERAQRHTGLQNKWQSALNAMVCGAKGLEGLPNRTRAAMNVLLKNQQNHSVGELLLRALAADRMTDELNKAAAILAALDHDKTQENWKYGDYLYRLAYFLVQYQQFDAALEFADIYYNKIYSRKGVKTELYATIQIERGDYDAAHAAIMRRKDDQGFEVVFELLLAKIAILKDDSAQAKLHIQAARTLDSKKVHEDKVTELEKAL